MDLNDLNRMTENLAPTDTMPVLFVGHGSPMNAIEDNPFSQAWRELGKTLPRFFPPARLVQSDAFIQKFR